MFQTTIGPVQEEGSTVYLRPETAQGIFLDFKTTLQFARKKPPFGIAQVGKSFRNEITPGNFIFRTLEFEQMEMEFFVPPDEAQQWYEYWCQERLDWYTRLGIRRERLRLRAARRRRAVALLVRHQRRRVPVPDRLVASSRASPTAATSTSRSTPSSRGEKLEWKDPQTGKGYIPHVIEPAAGLGRTVLALLCEAYDTDEIGGEKRTVLRLHPASRRSRSPCCRCCARTATPRRRARSTRTCAGGCATEYDEGGHIGKRYRRQDEIGTPFGVFFSACLASFLFAPDSAEAADWRLRLAVP